MSDEFSFLDGDSMIEESNLAISCQRPSDNMKTWNDSEIKSIVSGWSEKNGSSGETASIIAICESRGVISEIGISIFDIQSNYSDSSNYSKTLQLLTIYGPLRIIICSNSTENHRSKLYQTLLTVYPLDSLNFMPRSRFNEGKGREVIERLCTCKLLDGVLFGCTKKYYAFSTISALFDYLENELNLNISSKSLKFQVNPSNASLLLDYHTCKNLELITNGSGVSSQSSLLGVICKCQTAMGKRLLRTNLLQASTDLAEIVERQEAIEVMLNCEEILEDLRESLKKFPDIDNLISGLIKHDNQTNEEDLIHKALLLKTIFEKTRSILAILLKFGTRATSLLSTIIEVLQFDEIKVLIDTIDQIIDEDITYSETKSLQHHQRFYAVKDSTNTLLQVARRTLKEIQSDIYEYVEAWSKQIELPIEIKYSKKRGYFLSVKNSNLGGRPLDGICSQYKRGKSEVTFTTMDLIKLNGRIKESISEVVLASQAVLNELFDAIRDKIEVIYEISTVIARLDFICGLAYWALSTGSVCKPEFSCNGTLAIRQSRHPILETHSRGPSVVANDYFSCKGNSFTVITGANMSGKSTYCKQLALLCIMAQMGSFIPAEYGSFPIYDRILTRIGSDDELESNASSFRMEMKEAAYILEMLTNSSLVIIDELGRGTGYLEGLSVSISICDSIIERCEAAVLFVTHFAELIKYLKLHPRVSTIQFQSEISLISKDLKYYYKARSGIVSTENYGMKLAELSGLPRELMKFAWNALEGIKAFQGDVPEVSGVKSVLNRRRIILQTAERIKFVSESEGFDETVREEMIKEIKKEFENSLE